jgi:rod shape-determining protein MreD
MRHFLRTTSLWILVALLGETYVADWIDIRGIAPDFTIIALVLLGMSAGTVPATVGGFCLGLAQDVSAPAFLGLHALCKSALGFGIGSLRGRVVYGMPVVELLVLVAAVIAHDFVLLAYQTSTSGEAFLASLFGRSLAVAVYTGLVGVPVIRLADLTGLLGRED